MICFLVSYLILDYDIFSLLSVYKVILTRANLSQQNTS